MYFFLSHTAAKKTNALAVALSNLSFYASLLCFFPRGQERVDRICASNWHQFTIEVSLLLYKVNKPLIEKMSIKSPKTVLRNTGIRLLQRNDQESGPHQESKVEDPNLHSPTGGQ